MNKYTRLGYILTSAILLSTIKTSLSYADVIIDGQVYTDEWIAAHPAEVADYINKNPGAAAAILQNVDQGTQQTVLNTYNKATGSNTTLDQGKQWVNNTVTTQSTSVIIVNGQAYTDAWIAAHPAEVADYIKKNPGAAANILQNASQSTKDAVLNAYNKATGSNITSSEGQKWIQENIKSFTGRLVSGIDRNGNKSNVDIDFLAQSMKNGSLDVNSWGIKGYAQALKFSDSDIKAFQDYVNTHTSKEIANYLATLPVDTIIKIDEMRTPASVGISWRLGGEGLTPILRRSPESWQNSLEYAGISFTQSDLDKFYNAPSADIAKWLNSLPNDKFEKLQAYVTNAYDITGKPYFQVGWDDKSSYDPEIGRIVTPAEKDAIKRIKDFVIISNSNGNGTSSFLANKQENIGIWTAWKKDAFKEYLTEANIKDFVANPNKGVWTGGSNGNMTWKDGTVTSAGTSNTTTTSTTSNPSINISPSTSTTTVTNPYANTLSAATRAKLNAWIATNITSKANSLSTTSYDTLLTKVIAKLKVTKSRTTNTSKINVINYLISEIQNIQDSLINDDTSFLDSILN